MTCNDVRGAARQQALNGSQIKRCVNQLSMMLKLGRITRFDSYHKEMENTAQEIIMDGKMMDEINNFQHIGSNRMKLLQHIFVQETFSCCDRITDKTLPIIIVPVVILPS